jgi:hypothetical protein
MTGDFSATESLLSPAEKLKDKLVTKFFGADLALDLS